MSDRLLSMGPDAASSSAVRRVRARRAARRHSMVVRLLRRGMVVAGALTLVGTVAVFAFNPFRAPAGVSIEGVALDGTKVTMTNPKLSGFQKDGRPYAIEASRAVQDVKVPTLFELHDLKARLTMPDRTVTHLTAPAGAYNSVAETMQLTAGAHVVSDSGLDVTTQDALVQFKSNELTTDKPVTVVMPGRRIAADSMHIREGGRAVSFEGHVHSEWVPVQQTAAVDGVAASPRP